jgi:hypothetical protein
MEVWLMFARGNRMRFTHQINVMVLHKSISIIESSFFCFGWPNEAALGATAQEEERRKERVRTSRVDLGSSSFVPALLRRGGVRPSLPFESTPDLSVLTTKAPSVPGAFGKSSKISNNLAKKERAERERRHDNHQHKPYNAHYIFMTL